MAEEREVNFAMAMFNGSPVVIAPTKEILNNWLNGQSKAQRASKLQSLKQIIESEYYPTTGIADILGVAMDALPDNGYILKWVTDKLKEYGDEIQ